MTLVGSRLRQVNLWLDPARLRAYTLTAAEVTRAVANQNLQLPGGNLGQGARELTVRMKGRVNSVPEFDGIVVATRAGAQITLAQVGRAEDGTEEAETAGNVDGKIGGDPGRPAAVRDQHRRRRGRGHEAAQRPALAPAGRLQR